MSSKKPVKPKTVKTTQQFVVNKKMWILLPLIIAVLTFILYAKSLNNQLNKWDDTEYLTDNPNINKLHNEGFSSALKYAFTTYEIGNYHPITMLSYCLEYHFSKFNPKPYHLHNILLHILNSLLVFVFIGLLTKQQWIAFITALLFAIHPMHVESVAWVAERKDLLYSFFYLIGLCMYVMYLKNDTRKIYFYVITFFVFLLAVLSKAVAVSLPIALFAVDYFAGRKITVKTILEKVPFLVVSLVMGYVAILAQQSAGAIQSLHYDSIHRILFGCYTLTMYLVKLLVPVNLSCFYAYPQQLNWMYYMAPFFVLAFAFGVYKALFRLSKEIVFGVLFFIISIVLVLQFIPVGGAVMADRYTYIPSIGLFFIAAHFINHLINGQSDKLKMLKTPVLAFFTIYVVICCYLTIQRCKVWKTDMTLWADAVEKDDGSYFTRNARGLAYFESNQYDKSMVDFNRSIELEPTYMFPYFNKGRVYFKMGNSQEALKYFTLAISLNDKYEASFNNRGCVLATLGKPSEAIIDFTKAIALKPSYADAYYNRAGAYYSAQQFELALEDIKKAEQFGYTSIDPLFIKAIETAIKN